MLIREATDADLPAITHLFNVLIPTDPVAWRDHLADDDEMATWFAGQADAGHPVLVAEIDGRVAGYAYANQFRPRAAYRSTVEDSVYVAHDAIGLGIGQALLNELIERCTALGLRQVLAVIGDSQNAASIGAHRACGFSYVGVMTSVGRKFDRWVDVVIMQRPLGSGDASPPTDKLRARDC